MNKKLIATIKAVLTTVFLFAVSVSAFAAENVDITAGLTEVSSNDVAKKIIYVAVGGAAISGSVAVGMLIYLGYRLKTATEQKRAEVFEHIKYVFIGLAVVSLAVVTVGFYAFLLKKA